MPWTASGAAPSATGSGRRETPNMSFAPASTQKSTFSPPFAFASQWKWSLR